jgi:hypothetical protein
MLWSSTKETDDERNHFRSLPPSPPWNKGKITGPKPRLRPVTSGQYVQSWIWRSARATWRCSISPLISNCVAATSSRCASMTWRPMAMRSTEQMSDRERPAGPSAEVASVVYKLRQSSGSVPFVLMAPVFTKP